jgi:hypothetical protein
MVEPPKSEIRISKSEMDGPEQYQMSKLKVQMKSKFQMAKLDKKHFDIESFGIPLKFGF